MKKLLVALAVLAVLVVVLDRGGDFVAERQVASSLQDSQGLPDRPDVDITGIPFLTQFAKRDFDEVDVAVRDLELEAGATVSRLDVALHGVTFSSDFNTVRVEKADADAVIGYDALSGVLGIDLAYAGKDSVEASKSFTVAGKTFEPTIDVSPSIVDGAIDFGEPTVNNVNDVTGAIADAVDQVFETGVPLQGIPFDIVVDDLTVRRDGIHVRFSGADLTYVDKG